MYLFKIWSIDRQEKYFILVKVNRNIYQDVIAQASAKFRKPIDRIVLEKDGTLIDDEEILILLKDETLIALSNGERWFDSQEPPPPPPPPVTTPPIAPNNVSSAVTITDIQELGLKNDMYEISFEASNVIKSDVSDTYDSSNLTNDLSYISGENSQRSNEVFEGTSLTHDNNMEFIWGEFQVPWEKIPNYMLKACEEGKKNKQIMTEIIHIIVYEMRQIKTNIPARAFKYVAKRLADRFPDVFRDLDEDGIVIGDGTHSVTMKLLDRNNYLNRPHKRPWSSNETRKYRRTLQNAKIGCLNWEPSQEGYTEDLQSILKSTNCDDANFYNLLKQTYVAQRRFFNNVNNPPTIAEIKTNWPAILTTAGIHWHFKTLTSIDLTDIVRNIKEKSNKLIKFGIQKRLIEESEITGDNCDFLSLEVIARYFKETFGAAYRIFKDIERNDIETDTLLSAPCIVRFENPREWGHVIYLEKTPINDVVYRDFVEAFAISFALYFIANLQYPHEICFTMEMVQRYFCKIHPDVGSKSRKKMGAKARVLTLINKLHSL